MATPDTPGSTAQNENLRQARIRTDRYRTPDVMLANQLLQVAKTGGIGANIPLINKAVNETRAAGRTAEAGTQRQLGRTGLAGTPYGRAITQQQSGQTNTAARRTEAAIGTNIFRQIPAIIQGQAGLAAKTGLSAANTLSGIDYDQARLGAAGEGIIGDSAGSIGQVLGQFLAQKYGGSIASNSNFVPTGKTSTSY